VSKPSKRGLVTLLLIVITLGMGGWAFLDTFSNVGYAPQQPVPFSHKLHAGTRKIPCLYCHSNAERSRHATIPSTNVCMNCHLVVRTDRPAIQTVTKLYEEGKAIPWVRVHRVPDYVYFSHRWHVARGIACQTCHGQVQNMDVIRQAENLKMGWCISCHRQNKASQECNTCHM
jgi:Cytochrome c7 and related cytochrome c